MGEREEERKKQKTTSETMCVRNKLIRFLMPDTILVAFIENSFETIFFHSIFFLDKFKSQKQVALKRTEWGTESEKGRFMYTITASVGWKMIEKPDASSLQLNLIDFGI